MEKFRKESEIPPEEMHFYRPVRYNIGHSGHRYNEDGTLPEPEKPESWMILKEERGC